RWLQITGGAPSTRGADPLNHELYLKHRDPAVYSRARALLEPLDYLGLRFTGRTAATPASMVASWLTDNRPGAKLEYVADLVRMAGRDAQRLPGLVPTGTVLGTVLPAVADELGIRAVPVVAGIPDLHAAFIGSGATEPFQAHITISTTSWISCEVPFKKTDIPHQMASIPSGLRPNRYLLINNQETAGLCLKWVRDSLVQSDYDALCALAATVPAGSNGLMFTPWLTGERTPVEDRTLRSAFLNLSIGHGQAHIVRSVLEGVAFNARWMLDAVDRFVGRRLSTLRIQGGGAQSDLWCQIYADILDCRIERVADPRFHSLKGAGLFAAISLGKLTLDEVPGLVRVTDVYEPVAEHRKVYGPMYTEFKRFYAAMHGIYARLNSQKNGQ
ncbi:MAG TPA: FGGY-family carbohydrate kinase, partial [Candidatus Udaeobacter sp.]|nr:FGGY-family carbohydrate kinase [Candidatus Udaeobacter sp.]